MNQQATEQGHDPRPAWAATPERFETVPSGGIAGLATARALLRQGIEPEVVERAVAWSHPGAGCTCRPTRSGRWGALGLQAALLDRACVITRQWFLDHHGRVLLDMDLLTVWGATGPCAAISHRGLHELLREGIPVRLGTTATALDVDGVTARPSSRCRWAVAGSTVTPTSTPRLRPTRLAAIRPS